MVTRLPTTGAELKMYWAAPPRASSWSAPLPWWTWPAQLVARFYEGLRPVIEDDALLMSLLPRARWAPFAVLAVTFVFSFLHPGIRYVYTESLLFLTLALLIGLSAPSLGALLVASHIIFDLLSYPVALLRVGVLGWLGMQLLSLSHQLLSHGYVPFSHLAYQAARLIPYGDAPPGVLGWLAARLVSYWMLLMLVVLVPLMHRAIQRDLLNSLKKSFLNDALVVAGSALAVGVMVFIWTLAAFFLIRPAFTWLGQYPEWGYVPSVPPRTVLVLPAVLISALVSALHLKLGLLPSGPMGGNTPQPSVLPPFVRQIMSYAFSVFILWGLIGGLIDLVLLSGALVVSGTLAPRVLRSIPVLAFAARIHYFLRYLLGFALTFMVAGFISLIWYQPLPGSPFFPMVVSVAMGLIIFEVLLGGQRSPEPQVSRTEANYAVPGMALGAVLPIAFLSLAAPGMVLLNGCYGAQCIFWTTGGLCSAAATVCSRNPYREWLRWQRSRPTRERLGREPTWREFKDWLKGKPYIPPPTDDGQPIGGQAIPSAGAGTRG